MPEEKLALWENGPSATEEALKIEEINKILDPGYLPDENGFRMLENGTALVSNLTKCEGVTGEMFQWWFAWHPIDPLRYAIWDPFDHYDTTISEEDRIRAMDPTVSVYDKTFNLDQTVIESLVMGTPEAPIELQFRTPEFYGIHASDKLGTEALSFIVCANGTIRTPEGIPDVPAFMLHTTRDTEYGCELRSRFWIGYHIIDGNPVCMVPPGMGIPVEIAKQLYGHNITEFTNLASILPSVYAENKDQWD